MQALLLQLGIELLVHLVCSLQGLRELRALLFVKLNVSLVEHGLGPGLCLLMDQLLVRQQPAAQLLLPLIISLYSSLLLDFAHGRGVSI